MTFEEKLKQKLPELFHKNETGEMYVPCGCYCPVGWEQLTEDVLTSIRNHVLYSGNSERINVAFFKVYRAIWIPIYNFFYRLFNPEKVPLKERFFKTKRLIAWKLSSNEQFEAEKTLLGYKLRQKLKTFDTWIRGGRNEFRGVPIRPVKIEQIKEKFAGLRIYVSGGDDVVRGELSFAEYLSFKTCMWTGERGSAYNKGHWMVTASDEKAKELGLTKR